MNHLLLVLVFVFTLFSQLCFSQEDAGADIVVTIENVLTDGGQVYAALHTAETFMQSQGIDFVVAEGKKGALIMSFEGVEPGTYAIMVMHDLNGNNQMDFDSNGMPVESYGMSGKDMHMGPPTFEAAKFEVTGQDQELRIRF
ncbi:DUF2141 domain-containing protein [Muriicola soli]|uniref:DUF2141 domain-containing protein n=1 Tax=Muriicola soli TaxID=2507538 RepID=A0A411EA27_9FLAO|nr:DUF2141 domain-containing protein [Muriicola soli]QBA64498.1 DUF2141 domain-containing protein [Muriicola soli]